MAERLADYVEFSVGIQLDDPLDSDQLDDLTEQITSAACGGCLECGDGKHCENPEHNCKRLVVTGRKVHLVGDPEPEDA